MENIRAWLTGRLPDEWTRGEVGVSVDREEIVVVLPLPGPETEETTRSAAEAGRIARFREETRLQRMTIADEAEERFGRKVAWGAVCGGTRELFSHLAVPVMTRLRQPERVVLDTLVEAGVARSRAAALSWCVRLVGEHEEDWIARLRAALDEVEQARSAGPAA